MNVLIVSQNFTNGGLETQIKATTSSIYKNIKFFFAFGNYDESWNFNNVYTGFHFSSSSTIAQFCEDVNKLINIIIENNINIVHAHPFYSLFPAIFAAKICNIQIVYTYHGIVSYNFPSMLNDKILFNMLVDYEIDKIFCVSTEGKKIIENIVLEKEKVVFLPNSINTRKFSETKINNNKCWALISRLDTDKINELFLIINNIKLLNIEKLYIYGNGNEEKNLQNYVCENHLENKIIFKGYCVNLYEELQGKYNGVMGIGRSIMEALSMNYPVILIGYNKISGVIDDNIYSIIKNQNFSNKSLPTISIDVCNKQINKIYNNKNYNSFYSDFKNNFDSQVIADKYYEELINIHPSSTLNLNAIFDELKNMNSDFLFYNDINIYYILKKYLYIHCRFNNQNILFYNQEFILNQSSKITQLEEKILEQDKIITKHNNEIIELNKNTMTFNNLKRKIKYKFKH